MALVVEGLDCSDGLEGWDWRMTMGILRQKEAEESVRFDVVMMREEVGRRRRIACELKTTSTRARVSHAARRWLIHREMLDSEASAPLTLTLVV